MHAAAERERQRQEEILRREQERLEAERAVKAQQERARIEHEAELKRLADERVRQAKLEEERQELERLARQRLAQRQAAELEARRVWEAEQERIRREQEAQAREAARFQEEFLQRELMHQQAFMRQQQEALEARQQMQAIEQSRAETLQEIAQQKAALEAEENSRRERLAEHQRMLEENQRRTSAMENQLAAEGRDLYEKSIDVAQQTWHQEAMKAQLASEYQRDLQRREAVLASMNAAQPEDEESWKRDIERQVRQEMESKKKLEQAAAAARQIELDREEQERIREEAKAKVAREFALQQAAAAAAAPPRPAPGPIPAPVAAPSPMLDEAEQEAIRREARARVRAELGLPPEDEAAAAPAAPAVPSSFQSLPRDFSQPPAPQAVFADDPFQDSPFGSSPFASSSFGGPSPFGAAPAAVSAPAPAPAVPAPAASSAAHWATFDTFSPSTNDPFASGSFSGSASFNASFPPFEAKFDDQFGTSPPKDTRKKPSSSVTSSKNVHRSGSSRSDHRSEHRSEGHRSEHKSTDKSDSRKKSSTASSSSLRRDSGGKNSSDHGDRRKDSKSSRSPSHSREPEKLRLKLQQSSSSLAPPPQSKSRRQVDPFSDGKPAKVKLPGAKVSSDKPASSRQLDAKPNAGLFDLMDEFAVEPSQPSHRAAPAVPSNPLGAAPSLPPKSKSVKFSSSSSTEDMDRNAHEDIRSALERLQQTPPVSAGPPALPAKPALRRADDNPFGSDALETSILVDDPFSDNPFEAAPPPLPNRARDAPPPPLPAKVLPPLEDFGAPPPLPSKPAAAAPPLIPAKPLKIKKPVKVDRGRLARVLWDSPAEDADELDLRKGDIVEHIKPGPWPEWLEGQFEGRRGIFPENVVEMLQPEEDEEQEEQEEEQVQEEPSWTPELAPPPIPNRAAPIPSFAPAPATSPTSSPPVHRAAPPAPALTPPPSLNTPADLVPPPSLSTPRIPLGSALLHPSLALIAPPTSLRKKGTLKRAGDLTEDQAATLIQKVFRGLAVRRFMKQDGERRQVMQQLVAEDNAYLERLKSAYEWIYLPLVSDQDKAVIGPQDIKDIFHNFEKVVRAAEYLNESLNRKLAKWNKASSIGALFIRAAEKANFVREYSAYLKTLAAAEDVIKEVESQRGRSLKSFLKGAEKRGATIDALSLPRDQISVYEKLLSKAGQYTPSAHWDRQQLPGAQAQLALIDSALDEASTNHAESLQQMEFLRVVRDKIEPKLKDLVRPGRFYVTEGEIQLLDTKRKKLADRYFFLLNDLMLITTRKKKNFALKVHVTLATARVRDLPAGTDFMGHTIASGFELHTPKKSLLLEASPQTKTKLLAELNKYVPSSHAGSV